MADSHSTHTPPTDTPAPWAADFIASTQVCPVCFAQVAKHSTRENRGIMLATYVCAGEYPHMWDTRWGLAQVSP